MKSICIKILIDTIGNFIRYVKKEFKSKILLISQRCLLKKQEKLFTYKFRDNIYKFGVGYFLVSTMRVRISNLLKEAIIFDDLKFG